MDLDNEKQVNTHLWTMLSVASGMVGICATAIGLIGVVKSLKGLELLVDDLFAVGALLFLAVTGLAFLGLRTRLRARMATILVWMDVMFFIGLITVVLGSMLLTFGLI